jgi:hypothetical protein
MAFNVTDSPAQDVTLLTVTTGIGFTVTVPEFVEELQPAIVYSTE